MTDGVQPIRRIARGAWTGTTMESGKRAVPVEVAVAFVYNGTTHAVMMATPADLDDFAVGFSLSEGVIRQPTDLESLEVIESSAGIEVRMWLTSACAEAYTARRRFMAGPTGCGLCGIESLEEAVKPPGHVVSELRVAPATIAAALATLPAAQRLNAETRAVHAAGYWEAGSGLVALREDVGRHNALDKLAGALARQSVVASRGLLLLTSRVSVEMVQKASRIGVPVIVAVSAPTSLALETAEQAGITLVAIARGNEFEVFTRPDRVNVGVKDHVA